MFHSPLAGGAAAAATQDLCAAFGVTTAKDR